LQKGLVFYGIAFALVTGLSFLPLANVIPLLAMFLPTVTVLLMLLVVTRDGYTRAGWAELGLHRLGLRTWPLAVLAPVAVLGTASVIVWSSGLAAFAPPDLDALGWLAGVGQGFLNNAIFAMFTFSLGEEIGWRGYMLPKLARSLGNRRGMAVTGALHGVFHLPVVFFTPFYHPDGNRLLIAVFFIAAFSVGGLLHGYLRLSSGSVWPVSLAHSAHNYFWGLFGSMTVGGSALVSEYIAGEAGLLPTLGYGLLALWLLPRLASAQRPATGSEYRPIMRTAQEFTP
jgi:membrane protease YdiL (CAAX protease family)